MELIVVEVTVADCATTVKDATCDVEAGKATLLELIIGAGMALVATLVVILEVFRTSIGVDALEVTVEAATLAATLGVSMTTIDVDAWETTFIVGTLVVTLAFSMTVDVDVLEATAVVATMVALLGVCKETVLLDETTVAVTLLKVLGTEFTTVEVDPINVLEVCGATPVVDVDGLPMEVVKLAKLAAKSTNVYIKYITGNS